MRHTVRLSLVFIAVISVADSAGRVRHRKLSYFNERRRRCAIVVARHRGPGDLNNLPRTTRHRGGPLVLAVTKARSRERAGEMQQLDRSISASEGDYRQIPPRCPRKTAVLQFAADWESLSAPGGDIPGARAGGDRAAAIALYSGASKRPNDAASDALDALTAHNWRAPGRQVCARASPIGAASG